MLSGLGALTVFAQLVVNLRLLNWLPPNGSPYLMPCLLANACGFYFTLGILSPAIMSMLGDVVDVSAHPTQPSSLCSIAYNVATMLQLLHLSRLAMPLALEVLSTAKS